MKSILIVLTLGGVMAGSLYLTDAYKPRPADQDLASSESKAEDVAIIKEFYKDVSGKVPGVGAMEYRTEQESRGVSFDVFEKELSLSMVYKAGDPEGADSERRADGQATGLSGEGVEQAFFKFDEFRAEQLEGAESRFARFMREPADTVSGKAFQAKATEYRDKKEAESKGHEDRKEGFAASDESGAGQLEGFESRFARFMQGLADTIPGRATTAEAKEYLTGSEADGRSLGEIRKKFYCSRESRASAEDIITGFFRDILGRNPGSAEVESWKEKAAWGMSFGAIEQAIYGSDENKVRQTGQGQATANEATAPAANKADAQADAQGVKVAMRASGATVARLQENGDIKVTRIKFAPHLMQEKPKFYIMQEEF